MLAPPAPPARRRNRYPGVACDVPSYDYLPLLDEMARAARARRTCSCPPARRPTPLPPPRCPSAARCHLSMRLLSTRKPDGRMIVLGQPGVLFVRWVCGGGGGGGEGLGRLGHGG